MKGNLKNIMLIDDNEATNIYHEHIINISGCGTEVIKQTNSKSALRLLCELSENKQPIPELILVDINMPGMDGWQFVDELKKFPYGNSLCTKVMMLTTSPDPKDIERAKEDFLVVEFINKPLKVSTLNDILIKYFPSMLDLSNKD